MDDPFEAKLVARLLKERDSGDDPERAHITGDNILIEALRHLGWNALADEWQRQSDDWWWA